MSKLLAQHGPAKGSKIIDSIDAGNLAGAIFSLNDERFESIQKYINSNEQLNENNSFLDPQFYYSTLTESTQKKLSEIDCYPENVTRRDWRNKERKIIDYIDHHATNSKLISNVLITPGFYINNIDWHFDYSIEIYNYCINQYTFKNYALSLLIQSSFFNNRQNVEEMLEELVDLCDQPDYIYLTICYEGNTENNYEDIDSNCLSNIFSFIYQLKKQGFKFIIGYSFMNSILFSMLQCEFIASGWFNTLRKFQKSKFETTDTFGRRKKRYTSIPLLSNIMFVDINNMVDSGKISKEDILSNTSYDNIFLIDEDMLSFVDLEHQYWESLHNIFSILNDYELLSDRIVFVQELIKKAQGIFRDVCEELNSKDEQESLRRIKSVSKHLLSWQVAIDLFKKNEMII